MSRKSKSGLFKQPFYKALPAGSVVLPGKKNARLRDGRKVALSAGGKMVQYTAKYYVKIGGKKTALTEDYDESLRMAGELRIRHQRRKRGLPVEEPVAELRPKLLAPLFDTWIKEISGRAGTGHVAKMRSKFRIFKDCGIETTLQLSTKDAGLALAESLQRLGEEPASRVVLPKGDQFDRSQIRHLLGISETAMSTHAGRKGIAGIKEGRQTVYTRAEAEELIAHRNRGLAPATINGYRQCIKEFSAWLEERGDINRLPKMPRKLKEDPRYTRRAMTDAVLRQLVDSILAEGATRGKLTAPDRALLYRTAFYTTLRLGTLAKLTVGDLRFEGKTAFIEVRAEIDKIGYARPVVVKPDIAKDLTKLVKGRRRVDLVWIISKDIARALRTDLKKAGLPYVTQEGRLDFHAFRHSGATHLDRKGVPMSSIIKQAGWKGPEMYLRRYGHQAANDLANAVRKSW